MFIEQEKAINAYAEYMEKDPTASGMGIRDSSKLPYEKSIILKALITAIMSCDDDELAQHLTVAMHRLADFQDDVGSESITQLGISLDTFSQLAERPNKLAALINMPSAQARAEKYKSISRKAEVELETIYTIVQKAQDYRRQRLLG